MPKSLSRQFLFIILSLTFLIFTPSAVTAITIEEATSSDNTIINDTDDDLLVFGGEKVTVEGDVNGDLIVFSGVVDVMGEVEGNVYIISGKASIDNIVGKSVYVASGEVDIQGDIARDVFVAGGDVVISGDIGEDLSVAAGKVRLDGKVGDDVRVTAGQVEISNDIGDDLMISAGMSEVNGDIGGTVLAAGGDNSINSQTIGGDLLLYGEGNFQVNESIDIGGERKEVVIPTEPMYNESGSQWNWKASLGAGLWLKTMYSIAQGIGLVAVGYLIFKFAPLRVDATISKLTDLEDYLKSSLVGFIVFPIGLVLGLALLLSVVGWPVLKLLVVLFSLATVLVTPIAGIWLGRALTHAVGSKRRYIIPLTIGVMLIQIIRVIPILGWIFYWFLTIAVIGALIRMQWDKYQVAQNLHIKMKK